MKDAIKIFVTGAAGRMGRKVLNRTLAYPDFALIGANEHDAHPAVGRDVGSLAGTSYLDIILQPASVPIDGADVVIDFTLPKVTLALAPHLARNGTALITGTTGWTKAEKQQLAQYARKTVIFAAPNMSEGIAILRMLARIAGKLLGDNFDAEIHESHHRQKRDAPSGTALSLAESLGRPVDNKSDRSGPRARGTVGFATSRGGDIIGDHSVVFAGDGERIELTHRSHSRDIYALGALKAAIWAVQSKPGRLYSMDDVFSIDKFTSLFLPSKSP